MIVKFIISLQKSPIKTKISLFFYGKHIPNSIPLLKILYFYEKRGYELEMFVAGLNSIFENLVFLIQEVDFPVISICLICCVFDLQVVIKKLIIFNGI